MKIKYLLTLSFCIAATSNCNDLDPRLRDYAALKSAINGIIDYKNAPSIEGAKTGPAGLLVFQNQAFQVEAEYEGDGIKSTRRLYIEFKPTNKVIDYKPYQGHGQPLNVRDPVGVHIFTSLQKYISKLHLDEIPSDSFFRILVTRLQGEMPNYRALIIGTRPIIPVSHRLEAPPAPTPAQQSGSSNAHRAQQPNTGEFKCRYCAQAFRNAIAKGLHQENCPNKK